MLLTALISTDQALRMYWWLNVDPQIPLIGESFILTNEGPGRVNRFGISLRLPYRKNAFRTIQSRHPSERWLSERSWTQMCYYRLISKLTEDSNIWLVCNKWSNSLFFTSSLWLLQTHFCWSGQVSFKPNINLKLQTSSFHIPHGYLRSE